MSAKIEIITEGYANEISSEGSSQEGNKFMVATGSCCLVQSSGQRILFDTMGPWEKDMLTKGLADLRIHPDDIDFLVCSHSHPDHIGNLNLFTKAKKHFVGTSVYAQDVYDLNHFEPTGSYTYKSPVSDHQTEVITYKNHRFDGNVTVQPTPGHTMECVSMIVSNCDKHGKVGLVGDLFERREDLSDEGIWLSAGSQNPDLQRAHRAAIYNIVDFILPGHGPLFKTSRDIKL